MCQLARCMYGNTMWETILLLLLSIILVFIIIVIIIIYYYLYSNWCWYGKAAESYCLLPGCRLGNSQCFQVAIAVRLALVLC
jgi:hypothetical protein